MAAKTDNFSEYLEVLEIFRNIGFTVINSARQTIQHKIYHIFFTFDIKKLFEHPETFKKMNQLHSASYLNQFRLKDRCDYESKSFFGVKIDFK